MMRLAFEENREKYKITFVLLLVASACLLTYYFHVVLETEEVFTHFFYIPIILAALWWKRKGLFVALFLAVFLISSSFFLRAEEVTANDYLRAGMFIVISFIVGQLREFIFRAEQASKNALDERKKAEQILRESEEQYRTIIPEKQLRERIIGKNLSLKMTWREWENIMPCEEIIPMPPPATMRFVELIIGAIAKISF
jgi:hypothetical protein